MTLIVINLAMFLIYTPLAVANYGCIGLKQNICHLKNQFVHAKDDLESELSVMNTTRERYEELTGLLRNASAMNHNISAVVIAFHGLASHYLDLVTQVHDYTTGDPANKPDRMETMAARIQAVLDWGLGPNPDMPKGLQDPFAIVQLVVEIVVELPVGAVLIAKAVYNIKHSSAIVTSGLDRVLCGLGGVMTAIGAGVCAFSSHQMIKGNSALAASLEADIIAVRKLMDQANRHNLDVAAYSNGTLQKRINDSRENLRDLMTAVLTLMSPTPTTDMTDDTQRLLALNSTHVFNGNILQIQMTLYDIVMRIHDRLNYLYDALKKTAVIKSMVNHDTDVKEILSSLPLDNINVNGSFELYQLIAKAFPNKTCYENVKLECLRAHTISSQAMLDELMPANRTGQSSIVIIETQAQVHAPLQVIGHSRLLKHLSLSEEEVVTVIANSPLYEGYDTYCDWEWHCHELCHYRRMDPCRPQHGCSV